VLALKGAELDLTRVVKEDEVVDVSIKDSLVTLIDSLYAQGINFDINIDENAAVENVELKERLASMKKELTQLTEKIKEIPPEERVEKKDEKIEEQMVLQSPISLKQTFIQHTWNSARNTGGVPTYIYDPDNLNNPLAVIAPGEEKKFDLTDQTEVVIKFGTQQERVKVNPNRPPDVRIARVTTKMSGSDIYVQDLQRVTGYTVTIIDERPEQLKVTHSGPISVTGPTKDSKGNPVYNVSLNLASSEARFEEWLDRTEPLRENDGRYKVNFFFTIVDERSKDRTQVGDSFFFTEFSK
jgi:hypothetical protein